MPPNDDMSGFGRLRYDPTISESVKLSHLIDISNEMGLSKIEPHRPHKFDLNEVVNFKEIGDDLISRVKEAKESLIRHFGHKAEIDPDFKPYWRRDSSFVERYNQFSFPYRKLFENRLDYMEKADLTEKARFARPLSYFDLFYAHEKVGSISSSDKINMVHSRFPEGFIGFGAFIFGSTMMEPFSSSIKVSRTLSYMAGVCIYLGFMFYGDRRNSLQNNFSRLIDEPLKKQAITADKTIKLLQNETILTQYL